MTNYSSLRGAAVVAGALATGALGFPTSALAAPAPAPVPPAILDTTCSLDQLMAATKAVAPIVYGELVGKYNSEPPWLKGAVVNHLNMLLEKPATQRQAEVDQLARMFPAYVPLFVMAEPTASEVTAKCPTFPAVDPAVWNPAAPVPAPVAAPEPATASAAPVAPAAPAPAAAA